jgi:hypothetical protein
MRTLLVATSCGLLLALTSFNAQGQTVPPQAAPPAAAPATTAASDIVRLKNGGLLRGTIAELVPRKQVTILLVTGEKRTVSMDEVQYAGAASEAPKQVDGPASPRASNATNDGNARPSVTVHGQDVRLQLRADEPGITFYLRGGAAAGYGVIYAYNRVCTAPCEASLPAGTYIMAISQGSGEPRPVSEPVVLTGPSTLQGSVASGTGLRLLGVAIMIGGVVGGIVLLASASTTHQECTSFGDCIESHDLDTGRATAGAAVGTAGILTGLLMLTLVKDKAAITISPGTPASVARARPGDDASAVGLASRLAGLQMRVPFSL